MKKSIVVLIMIGILFLTACSKGQVISDESIEKDSLIYSNLIDDKTQQQVKNILIENEIKNQDVQYFIELVKDYNKNSSLEDLKTSKDGFTSIDTLQVPYDEVTLSEKMDYMKTGYVDFNCRLTAFSIYKNWITATKDYSKEDFNIMFDIDAIENNPMSKFSKEEIKNFKSLYSAIEVKNTQDVEQLSQMIVKEWKNRGIDFGENDRVKMINAFIHSPEDDIVFVGHGGISIKTNDGIIFVEKYANSLPYQVSKFKNMEELKAYLMDRLDVNTSGNGAAKPIIMENYNLIK